MNEWLLLNYKVPPHPTSSRVYVWRKLKKMGALLIMDSVWLLPATTRTMEQFQWLAAEIVELSGEAQIWKSNAAINGQEEAIIQQFVKYADAAYKQLLDELQVEGADLSELSRKFQHIQSQDYFHSEVGKKVKEALLSLRGGYHQ